MPSPEVLAAFFGVAVLLGLAPGPDNIFVLTQSALYGTQAGIYTTLGLVSGLSVHTLAVALGVAAFLIAFPVAFIVLKCAGAIYLLWLAWQSLGARPSVTGDEGGVPRPGYFSFYKRGVVMNVTNPKVALFFLAFLPQFCSRDAGPMFLQIILLGFLFMLATIMVFFTVALLGGRLAAIFNRSPRAQIFIHRAAAAIFAGLAVALIFADTTGAGA